MSDYDEGYSDGQASKDDELDRILAETVGFVFAYACDSLDKGIDPRTVEFPEVLEAAQKALLY